MNSAGLQYRINPLPACIIYPVDTYILARRVVEDKKCRAVGMNTAMERRSVDLVMGREPRSHVWIERGCASVINRDL
jgi:hypothetical protein